MGSAVEAMLRARSVAVVGASPREGSFGQRMVSEALRETVRGVRVHLVNPRYDEIEGQPCAPSISAVGEPLDLVLLGVGDHALSAQLAEAAAAGARSAVVFGSAHAPGLRAELAQTAADAGMAVCGAGCMGFINVSTGLRALGYIEREVIAPGPVALITHSGSVFSTMLRTRRAIGYSLAVSSGQELVTSTADYLEYILDDGSASLVGLVLETIRQPVRLRAQLRRAAESGVSVVVLPVGGSPAGSRLVAAHSGAIAGGGAAWEALCDDTGALSVRDLSEFSDTLELLALARGRRRVTGSADGRRGIATVHDSGAERALTADLAHELGVPFARIGAPTQQRLAAALDDGLAAENPLDVWGTGADTRGLFRECLSAMAADPAVAVTVLAVDLVAEYDGDTAYPDAVLDAAAALPADAGPIAVLAALPAAVDDAAAARLRQAGVAVLEGTRSGLVALRNLLQSSVSQPSCSAVQPVDRARQARWRDRLRRSVPLTGVESFALLSDYGIAACAVAAATGPEAAVAVAGELGYPVVLKTDQPGVAHKSDAGGVRLGLRDGDEVRAAYRLLAADFGPQVLVCATAPAGIEVSIGLTRDAMLGPMLVLAAGGTLIELLDDRVVALPPVSPERARDLIGRLRVAALVKGFRGTGGSVPGDLDALARSIAWLSQLAIELGDQLGALDVNPVIVSAAGAVAVDVLAEPLATCDQKIE